LADIGGEVVEDGGFLVFFLLVEDLEVVVHFIRVLFREDGLLQDEHLEVVYQQYQFPVPFLLLARKIFEFLAVVLDLVLYEVDYLDYARADAQQEFVLVGYLRFQDQFEGLIYLVLFAPFQQSLSLFF
jgi:hypothetical protein